MKLTQNAKIRLCDRIRTSRQGLQNVSQNFQPLGQFSNSYRALDSILLSLQTSVKDHIQQFWAVASNTFISFLTFLKK